MSKKSLSQILSKAVARISKIQVQRKKKQIKTRIKQIKSQKIIRGRNIFIEPVNIKENVFFKEK